MRLSTLQLRQQTSSLKTKSTPIDLTALATDAPDARYNPNRFPAAFLRLTKGSCNIFHSGTIVLNGVKRIADIEQCGTELAHLQHRPIVFQLPNDICNWVASFQLFKMPAGSIFEILKYKKVKQTGGKQLEYYVLEQDIQNSLQCRLNKTTILLHHTGKGIITGATSFPHIDETLELLWKLLNY